MFTAISTVSALILLGLLPSQAGLPKSGMILGQNSNTEPSVAPSPSVAPVRTEKPEPSPEPSVELPSAPDPLDAVELESLNAKVLEVNEQFVELNPSTHIASFNAKAAKDAGYDSDIIKLVKEQIDFQNELVTDLKAGKTKVGKTRPSPQKYPKLRRFEDRAKEKAKKAKPDTPSSSSSSGNGVKVAGVSLDRNVLAANTLAACGDYYYPKPNRSPTRYYYNQVNPPARTWLTSNGFHTTIGYATTAAYRYNYTRPTYYSGVQGTCDSPKFRDDGTVNEPNGTYTMNIQYKEPNPEIFEPYYGLWPYGGWGQYVNWWHNTY